MPPVRSSASPHYADPRLVAAISALPIDREAKGTLLATTLVESGGRLDAVGDSGSSFGPYQMHRGGRLTAAGFTPQQAMDPVASTQAAWKEFSALRTADPGAWAARAQRPADPLGYAKKVRGVYQQALSMLGGGTGKTVPTAPVGGAGGETIGGFPAPSGFSPAALAKLNKYLAESEKMALAGKMPGDPIDLFNELLASRGAGAPTVAPMGTPGRATGGQEKLIGTPHSGTHTLGNWQSDNAVDLSVPEGTPIFALEDGTIGSRFGSLGKGGRFAGLRMTLQGAGNSYYYAHLSQYAPGIKPGARVRRGQVIGYSGTANGVPHLHLGVERGDPRAILGMR